jgi:hypothetical protein
LLRLKKKKKNTPPYYEIGEKLKTFPLLQKRGKLKIFPLQKRGKLKTFPYLR